jgi:hypothetical protein
MTQQTNWQALCADIVRASDAVQHDATAAEGDFLAAIDNARIALAQPEPEERPIWTEGVCGDGAAILKDGVMQPIESVIAALNAAELAQPEPEGATDWELETIEAIAQIVYENAMLATAPEHARPHWPSWGNLPNSDARIHSLNTAEIILTRYALPVPTNQ